jgi:D-inositol-3-phosphate glycosyltransferase
VKLAVLSPAPPHRGGIVAFSATLIRELRGRGHDVFWSGYRKQYPRLLFPGSDQEGELAAWLPRDSTPRFVPWSPRSWRRAADDIAAAGCEAAIIKYWIPFVAPGIRGVARRLRRRGVRVVYILHNVIPHERYPLGLLLTRLALAEGQGFIALSEQVRSDLLEVLPGADPARVVTCPHPVYDFTPPGSLRKSRAEARAALGLSPDARIVLFFGFIKPYKGVVHLIEAAPRLKERYRDGLSILVVGDVYGDRRPYDERIRGLGVGDVVRLVDGYVPDEAVEDYFLAADVVVLPYVSASQSGIVQIAYNYGRPVITTRVGGLPEVVRDGRTGFLVPPADPEALAAAVIRFFDEDWAERLSAGAAEARGAYGWERLAETVEKLARG